MRAARRVSNSTNVALMRSPSLVLDRAVHSRAGVIRILGQAGQDSPDHVLCYTEPERIGEHLAQRQVVTLMQAAVSHVVLHVIDREPSRMRVQGARVQDRHGRSFSQMIGGVRYFTGREQGHRGMGTRTLDAEALSARFLRWILKVREDPDDMPASKKLANYFVGLDAGTESVPAFFNRSFGTAIEGGVIQALGEVVPLATPGGGVTARSVNFEVHRAYEVLSKPETMVKPVAKRLLDIKHGRAKPFLQNPADTANLVFEGREPLLLEATYEEIQSVDGQFSQFMSAFMRDLPERMENLVQIAAAAREECMSKKRSAEDPEKTL